MNGFPWAKPNIDFSRVCFGYTDYMDFTFVWKSSLGNNFRCKANDWVNLAWHEFQASYLMWFVRRSCKKWDFQPPFKMVQWNSVLTSSWGGLNSGAYIWKGVCKKGDLYSRRGQGLTFGIVECIIVVVSVRDYYFQSFESTG